MYTVYNVCICRIKPLVPWQDISILMKEQGKGSASYMKGDDDISKGVLKCFQLVVSDFDITWDEKGRMATWKEFF